MDGKKMDNACVLVANGQEIIPVSRILSVSCTQPENIL